MSRRHSSDGHNVAGLVLAAGMSTRAGDINKLVQLHAGKPLVQHVAQALTGSQVTSTLVVLGHDASMVEQAVIDTVVAVSVNKDYARGQSTSLVHGVSLLYESDAIVVCLGDMPHITSDIINTLINVMRDTPEKSYFVPVFKGQKGNPVLIRKERFDDIMRLSEDSGARSLMRSQPYAVMEVPVDCEGVLIDYDTREELEKLCKSQAQRPT